MGKTSTRRASTTSDHSQPSRPNAKRKTPPKFQHLPLSTARKLKQQWVERKKLQSQYFGRGAGKRAALTQVEGSSADVGAESVREMGEDEADGVSVKEEEEEDEEDEEGEGDDLMHSSPEDEDEFEDPDDYRMRTPSPFSADSGNILSTSPTSLGPVARTRYRGGTSLKREEDLPSRAHKAARAAGAAAGGSGSAARGHGVGVGEGERGYQGGSPLGRVDRKGSVRRKSTSSGGGQEVSAPRAGGKMGKAVEQEMSWQVRQQQALQEREEAAGRRERARLAYSRKTLHTYRSDPLSRKSSTGKGGGGAYGNGRVGQGRRGEKGRGRGQPDMKLRMGVLLERIKRNVGA